MLRLCRLSNKFSLGKPQTVLQVNNCGATCPEIGEQRMNVILSGALGTGFNTNVLGLVQIDRAVKL